MNPTIILGAKGQDGQLLGKKLEREGRQVVRIGRGDLDLLDPSQVKNLILQHRPCEVYYLAAHHHSAEDPIGNEDAALFRRSFEVNVTGPIHILEAIRVHSPATRFFYAASSHIFGQVDTPFQDEQTPCNPLCVYGITKTAGLQACRYYRQNHGLFASGGILFNHESQYRRENFVTQKIIRAAQAIAKGQQDKLVLGSLSARIDWGYAPDYVGAMVGILALPKADDYVIATGETHSVQEFVEIAFEGVGLDWRKHVVENPSLITKQPRILTGNSSKLHAASGWKPTVSFRQMVELLLTTHPHAE